MDKIRRAIAILTTNEIKVKTESLRDTIKDLRIYTMMFEGLLNETNEANPLITKGLITPTIDSQCHCKKCDACVRIELNNKALTEYLINSLMLFKWKNLSLDDLKRISAQVNIFS